MDDYKVNGAVIVTEVSTGDIVAMASRPNFNQNSIDTYLNKGNMEFFNKAVQVSYPPGSLFKIVVLLAGLQEDMNLVNKEFYCRGYEQINDLIIKCSKEEGHGKINLKNAFAQSCNSVFIQIGERIGAKKIIEMAKKLGFGEKINIGLMEEVKGNLPEGRELIGPAIGNISIGQGTIEATPLQIANMITIVANNGIKKSLSIVDEIVTEDGYSVKKFNREDDVRIIEQKYCEIVRDYLNEVVISGTAKKVNLEDIGGAGGKTGSAQAILNKQPTIHGWFVGYFPRENPKYTVTILVEEGHSGSSSAVPIFEKIVRKIQEINR
jgi:peptidoglycan glycosyltransferase/penicillin-binding protein 2